MNVRRRNDSCQFILKQFEKFAHRQFKSLISHLKKFRDHKKPEMLHQMLVDIKKIKAILGLINASKKRFKAHKNFIPLRNISRKAAEIRDRKIHVRLLTSRSFEKHFFLKEKEISPPASQ